MNQRAAETAATVAAAILALLVVVAAVAMTRGAPHPPPLDAVSWEGDFSAAEHAAAEQFRARLLPALWLSLAVSLAVWVVLGFTPIGTRLVSATASVLDGRGGWAAQVVVGSVLAIVMVRLATLGFSVWREFVLRDVGLSTRSWAGWAADVARSLLIQGAILVVVVLVIVGLARAGGRFWWALGAVAGAALVVTLSFAYPLVVEPAFNRFTPMPASTLRDELLALAEKDQLPVQNVLVADASRRTSTLNAYVSGLGSSRRLVVYDNLIEDLPADQVRAVVAHELGHVKAHDVREGTAIGALAVAAGMCALGAVGPWLAHRAGAASLGDPRSAVALLAAFSVLSALSLPLQNALSRRIEARADEHALELTRDPQAVVTLNRSLAVAARSDLDPGRLTVLVFGSHPSAPQRIAAARDWALDEAVPVPAPLAP